MASSIVQRYQALIENSPDAIFLMNGESKIAYASASTAKVLGYSPEELLGQNGLDFIHPQDRDHSVRSLKDALVEPQSPQRMQARVRQKDGQWLWVESTLSNLLDEPDVGAILVNYREISRRRAAEEDRQKQTEELARSNVELQAFAHTVAHDLREPLRTISSFTQILIKKAQLEQNEQEIAQFIVDAVKRMTTLLDGLLSAARYGFSDPPHCVSLDQAAGQAMQDLRQALVASSATVTVEPLPRVQGNECDLVRVFQNLIGNAVKYRSEAPVEIHITAEQSGPDWVIKVHDNGIGIARKNHQRIFGLFTRLHTQEIPGTGIGLALCKKIVEGLGGAIWVESEPGAGSTFCFSVAAAIEGDRQLATAS